MFFVKNNGWSAYDNAKLHRNANLKCGIKFCDIFRLSLERIQFNLTLTLFSKKLSMPAHNLLI